MKVRSDTDGIDFAVAEGQSLLEASLAAGIAHTHVCGGNARCSTCRVWVSEGIESCAPRNDNEEAMSRRLGFPSQVRLACQTRIHGDLSIRRLVVDEVDKQIIRAQLDRSGGGGMGHEREIAVLFADLADYTGFAEHLPAFDVVHVLNRYYHTMNRVVEAHRGVISDVAGDGMLALFGACGQSETQVQDAIDTVREMHAELAGFNDYLQRMYGRTLGMRAGIHFGPAIVGDFSTGPMTKVAAIGDNVNLASRIETANKLFGSSLLISEAAYGQLGGGIEVRGPHECELKGKSGRYALYEVLLQR